MEENNQKHSSKILVIVIIVIALIIGAGIAGWYIGFTSGWNASVETAEELGIGGTTDNLTSDSDSNSNVNVATATFSSDLLTFKYNKGAHVAFTDPRTLAANTEAEIFISEEPLEVGGAFPGFFLIQVLKDITPEEFIDGMEPKSFTQEKQTINDIEWTVVKYSETNEGLGRNAEIHITKHNNGSIVLDNNYNTGVMLEGDALETRTSLRNTIAKTIFETFEIK